MLDDKCVFTTDTFKLWYDVVPIFSIKNVGVLFDTRELSDDNTKLLYRSLQYMFMSDLGRVIVDEPERKDAMMRYLMEVAVRKD